MIVNKQAVLKAMVRIARSRISSARVRVVTVNSSHTFAQQLSVFASCDLMVSVHGSQNANVMFMRAGAAFMELNPHKFFYSSYEALSSISRVLYLPSRHNIIADASNLSQSVKKQDAYKKKKEAFLREFGKRNDVQCQEISRCRALSRNFPTIINMSDFEREFARGLDHLATTIPQSSG